MGRTKRTRGFTLVELAAIVVVVGILASVAIVAVNRARESNELTLADQSVSSVAAAQFDFADRYGTYTDWPADLDLPDGPQVSVEPSDRSGIVCLAMSTDGAIGLAAGNGSECVLRTITSPLDGAAVTERTVGDNVSCSGSSALPSGSERTVPQSRQPL